MNLIGAFTPICAIDGVSNITGIGFPPMKIPWPLKHIETVKK